MNTVIKTIITTVLLSVLLATTSDAEARLKYYRYNANIPMVEMTLNMMVAMGVLEQIPGRLVHDGNPYNRMVRARSRRHSASPYALPANTAYYDDFLYDDFGFDDFGYGDYGVYDRYRDRGYSPYRRYYDSPYGYSDAYSYGYSDPYSSWDGAWASPWGDPGYTTWGNPWNSVYGSQWYSPYTTRGNPWTSVYGNQWNSPWGNRLNYPWGTTWNNPWGGASSYPWGSTWNSPWSSPWSNTMMNPLVNPYGGVGTWSGVPGSSSAPISPGYTPGTQGYSPGYTPGTNQGNASTNNYRNYGNDGTTNPAERGRSGNAPVRTDKTDFNAYTFRKSASRQGSAPYRKPSQTVYSGTISKHDRRLDGLWIGESGEMLGIRGNDFLWYDGKDRYAKGKLVKTPTMMKAKIERSKKMISLHYRLIDNELFTVSKDGKMRIFNRTPLMQQARLAGELDTTPSSYQSDSPASIVSKSKFASDIATPLTPYAKETSATLASYTNRRTETIAPLELYRGEQSPMWGPGASSAVVIDDEGVAKAVPSRRDDQARNRLAANRVPAASSRFAVATYTDHGSDVSSALPSIMPNTANAQRQPQDGKSTAAESFNKRAAVETSDERDSIWKPLTPYSTTLGYKNSAEIARVVAPSVQDADDFEPFRAQPLHASRVQSHSAAGVHDKLDPYPYLFSYLKDKANGFHASGRNATNTKDSGNIWKPNESFADTRRQQGAFSSHGPTSAITAASEMSASYSVRKFVWPVNRDWY